MHTKKLLLAALIGTLFAPAFAADIEDDQAERVTVITHEAAALDGLRLAGPLMRHGKLVKNAPFSAEAISERLQNLTDGNQISQRSSTMSYRDSSGRTRQEVRDTKGELRSITIRDGEGTIWMLNPRDKTATKIAINREAIRAAAEAGREAGRAGREAGRAAAEAARAKVEQLRKEGKLVERHGPNGEEIVIKRIERVDGEAGKNIQENVRIQVNTAMAEASAANGLAFAGAFTDARWSGKATTRDLGTKDIEGVKADGKIRSYEIPAGEMGNRNPIVVSDEIWYSPDLQVTMLTKHSDPRNGDTVYRLANVKREEPAAALFTVPSDYVVKDAMSSAVKTIEKKTP